MRQKILKLCKTVYSWGMTSAFLAGGFPILPIALAIFVGKNYGETITIFFLTKYYPFVFLAASVSMLAGVIATYLEKQSDK